MKSFFILDVRRKQELLSAIIDRVQDKAKISFEGKLGHIEPKISPSTNETSVIKRNSSISNDFWVFDIDGQTKDYLKREILNMVGLSYKVHHIFVQEGDELIFEAVDNFSEDCVALHKKSWVKEGFVKDLVVKGIIWGYRVKNSD